MFKFLISKSFFKQLGIALVTLTLILWITFKLISTYTLHGETIVVPNLVGLSLSEIKNVIDEKGLRFVVVDSLYDKTKKKGTAIDQDPIANFNVKKNRTIYVTLSSFNPAKVQMPSLVDVSLRQATAMLETYGLQVGKLSYVPDFAKNAVIRQYYKGNIIKPGEMIVKESKIDLVLGDGLKGDKVSLPNLIGLSRAEAISRIVASSLNVGIILPDASVKDSSLAKVYKQVPSYTSGISIKAGKQIDIFITQDDAKMNGTSDSLKVEGK